MKLQIYCRLPSDRFAALSNAAGIESRLDHRVVRLSHSHATNYPLFDDDSNQRRR